ncbi:MAG: Hsp20/alpha crystallin family protein [Burkholderiales bacterium]
MSSRNATSLMWADACELLDQADRMHRQFFRLGASGRTRAVWEPPVDVFEDERDIIIIVALPGVSEDSVEITVEAGLLVLRAERRIPFAGARGAVRRLEIPYGHFERRIQLANVRLEAGTREFRDGCLILRLRKAEAL